MTAPARCNHDNREPEEPLCAFTQKVDCEQNGNRHAQKSKKDVNDFAGSIRCCWAVRIYGSNRGTLLNKCQVTLPIPTRRLHIDKNAPASATDAAWRTGMSRWAGTVFGRMFTTAQDVNRALHGKRNVNLHSADGNPLDATGGLERDFSPARNQLEILFILSHALSMKSTLKLSALIVGGLAAACLGLVSAEEKAANRTDSDRKAGKSTTILNAEEQKFLTEAADGGMLETELGRLAEEKAANAEVKEFARTMIKDHGKLNEQFRELAMAGEVKLPKELSDKHGATVERLKKLSGREFDNAYVNQSIRGHRMAIEKFERAAAKCENAKLKSLIEKSLPHLRQHLASAQKLPGAELAGVSTTPPGQ